MIKIFLLLLFLLSYTYTANTVTYGAIATRDSSGNWAMVDPVSGSIQIISFAHHELHEGDTYLVCAKDADLDDGDTLSFAWLVPDTTREQHLVLEVSNTVGASITILEGPTVDTTTGTDVPIYNRHRRSANMSMLQHPNGLVSSIAVKAIGGVENGTVIESFNIGAGGNPQQASGGSARGVSELITKANTVYMIIMIGLADNGSANMELDWYEHIPNN